VASDPTRSPTEQRLLDVATALADGHPIRPETPDASDPDTTGVLRQLQAIEQLSAAFAQARETAVPPSRTVLFRWGHLDVLSPVGQGGFGEVYRAWDPLLQREVALKLRRPDRSSSAGTDRQVEEARRLAKVRHPNVLLIHGVGVHDERAGFWSELIQGETLEQLLVERGPFGGSEVVAIGTELCRALSALHGAGIVHGDVKGSNVMREQGGRIVLMDLGAAHDGRDASPVQATPSAAADEILRGEAPKVSSDVYSLGALLFRLLTGAHHREAPPLSDLRPDLPTSLVSTIERALDTDPARRFPSAGMMSQALQNAFTDERRDSAHPVPPRRTRWTTPRAVVACGVAVVGLALAWGATRSGSSQDLLRVSQLRPFSMGSGSYTQAAVSPDGQRVAFISDASGSPQVWVQNLTGGDARQLTSESVMVQRPAWLGDNERVVYSAWGNIRTIAVDGQDPQPILRGWNAHASLAGTLVLERGEEVWTAARDGADAAKVAGIPERPSRVYERLPALSPDGSMIAFLQATFSRWGDIWIVPVSGGQPRRVTADGKAQGRPAWTPDGKRIVYPSRLGGGLTLWQVDAGCAIQDGPQAPSPLLQSDGEDTDPAFSPDGRTIVYTATNKSYSLSLLDPATGGERTLHESPLYVVAPEVSRDGRRIAFFGGGRDGELNVYTMDIAGGAITQVTHGTESVFPIWSADDRDLLFFHVGPEPSWRRVAASGGPSTVLKAGWTMSERMHVRPHPSGRYGIYTWYERDVPRASRVVDMETGREREFHRVLRHPIFSPDGQSVLGVDASRLQALIAPLLICPVDPGPCRHVGHSGAVGRWSPDGRRVYFQRPLGNYNETELWSVDVDGGDARKLLTFHSEATYLSSFDVTPSGHIVLSRLQEGRQQLWLAELEP
jgi:Tol biopolymer transport system component